MKKSSILLLSFCLISSIYSIGQTSLLSTDFESGIPAAYSLVDNDGFTPNAQVAEYTSPWIHVEDPEDETNHVAGSTSYFSPAGTASRWLITPQLDLGTYGNFISWKAMSHDASFPDDYLVLVSTTTTDLESFTDTIGYVQEEYAEWTTRTVNLSSKGYDGLSIYIAFVNVTNDGFKLYLDDIEAWKEDPVGILENDPIAVTVYPNPFKDEIAVNCDCSISNMKLIDLKGQLIQQVAVNQLSTESVVPGVYFLQIESNKGSFTRKVIKH